MNRPAVTCAVCCLLIVLAALSVAAQTEEQGTRVLDEACKPHGSACPKADLQKALRKYEQALHIFEHVQFLPGVSRTAYNAGDVLLALQQCDRALEYYKRSHDICCKLGYEAEQGPIFLNMGVSYFDSGHHDRALASSEKAPAIARKVKNQNLEGYLLGSIADGYAARGQHEKAWEMYERSRTSFRKLGDMRGEAVILYAMAKYCRHQGKYSKALQYYVTSRFMRWRLELTADLKALLQKLVPKQ